LLSIYYTPYWHCLCTKWYVLQYEKGVVNDLKVSKITLAPTSPVWRGRGCWWGGDPVCLNVAVIFSTRSSAPCLKNRNMLQSVKMSLHSQTTSFFINDFNCESWKFSSILMSFLWSIHSWNFEIYAFLNCITVNKSNYS
jgi:hypothetical protein